MRILRKINAAAQVFAMLLFLCPLLLSAQQRVYRSPHPGWIAEPALQGGRPEARKITEGYYIKLYDYQVHVEQQVAYTRIVREIVAESGVQSAAEIRVSYLPAYQRLTFHEVVIIRGGQRIDKFVVGKFQVAAVEGDAASYIYNGNHVAYLLLDDVRVGDIISYSYSISGRNPVFEGKFFDDIYLQGAAPIAQLYAAVLASPSRPLYVKTFNGAKQPVTSTANNLKRLVWEGKQIDAVRYDDYAPQWYNPFQHAQLSEFASWAEVGAWGVRVNPLANSAGGEVAARANALLQAAKGNLMDFAQAAIRFVQDEIRYTGVAIGEHSHRANPPEKVLLQRYGDCKDKSLLLAAMLRHAGIQAHLVLVNTHLGARIKDQLPSPYAFNHAVTAFEIDNRPYWIDATFSHQGGTLATLYRPEYGAGLVLKPTESDFLPLHAEGEGGVFCRETYDISAEEVALATLRVETVYTGHEADATRIQFTYGSIWDIEKNYLDYYSRFYPQIERIDSVEVIDDRGANRLTVIEQYRIPAFLVKNEATSQHEVGFYANMIGERLPSLSGRRTTPVAVNYPSDINYTIEVKSPHGWNIPRENFFLDRDGYVIGCTTSTHGDTLKRNYQFRYHKREIPAAQSGEFASDIKTITDNQLSFGFGVNLATSARMSSKGISWYALIYTLLVLAGMAYFGWRLYRRDIPPKIDMEEHFIYERIGGWLILPFIGFCLTPIAILIFIWNDRYYHPGVWNVFQGTPYNAVFKSILAFEFTGNLVILSLAVLCVVFCLRRKVVLPALAVGFYLFSFGIAFIDFVLMQTVALPSQFMLSDQSQGMRELIRAFVVAAIWIPYFLFSSRVKTTFVK
ncbi:Transglutaminase-like enzyme, putative cysteine protease [Parapedobacter composti]|uniref:Transglutaminase-like enzyme, putative cysteine protease n=1 Tax=Parapedobacter composti TaxID=623281 RepID=A0A1I1KU80_9SPHI|nr:DUF3857 domain-containing protein [Parapedobacter composti]SFC64175.1 Transglutaminase-like enzyme, putative cysteine protease [Parapedobacter composti]